LPLPHEGADRGRDLLKSHGFAEHLVKFFSRTPQFLRRVSDPDQQIDNFASPKQMRRHDRINVRVGGRAPHEVKADTTPWSLLGFDHAAPPGCESHHASDMSRCRYDRQPMERLTVDADLGVKPAQRIFGTFDFVSVDAAIDNCNVDPALGMGKAQLVDDKSIEMRLRAPQMLSMQRGADCRLSHQAVRHRHHLGMLALLLPEPKFEAKC